MYNYTGELEIKYDACAKPRPFKIDWDNMYWGSSAPKETTLDKNH